MPCHMGRAPPAGERGVSFAELLSPCYIILPTLNVEFYEKNIHYCILINKNTLRITCQFRGNEIDFDSFTYAEMNECASHTLH